MGNFFVIAPAVLCPLSRMCRVSFFLLVWLVSGGSVTINSTNPLDPPVINPNYLAHAQDLAIMKYAVESAKEFVTAVAWEGYVLTIATNTTDQDIRNGASNLNHPVGTASMSPAGCELGSCGSGFKDEGHERGEDRWRFSIGGIFPIFVNVLMVVWQDFVAVRASCTHTGGSVYICWEGGGFNQSECRNVEVPLWWLID